MALGAFPVKFLRSNMLGRDFVMGDVHGCMEELHALLRHVGFRKAIDRLFLVGDIIDRGPYSKSALDLLKQPWCMSVRGNHEDMLINHLRQRRPAHDGDWLQPLTASFTDRQKFAGAWLPILEGLPYVLCVGSGSRRFHVVHAEILENKQSVTNGMIETWSFKDPDKARHRALWGRSLLTEHDLGRPVVRAHHPETGWIYCGHSIVDMPTRLARQVFLDGGCAMAYTSSSDPDEDELHVSAMHQPGLWMVEPSQQRYWKAEAKTCVVSEHAAINAQAV